MAGGHGEERESGPARPPGLQAAARAAESQRKCAHTRARCLTCRRSRRTPSCRAGTAPARRGCTRTCRRPVRSRGRRRCSGRTCPQRPAARRRQCRGSCGHEVHRFCKGGGGRVDTRRRPAGPSIFCLHGQPPPPHTPAPRATAATCPPSTQHESPGQPLATPPSASLTSCSTLKSTLARPPPCPRRPCPSPAPPAGQTRPSSPAGVVGRGAAAVWGLRAGELGGCRAKQGHTRVPRLRRRLPPAHASMCTSTRRLICMRGWAVCRGPWRSRWPRPRPE